MHLAQMALNNLRRKIPVEILEKAFLDPSLNSYDQAYSLDSIITHEVIKGQVYEDCNVVGGTEQLIPLSGIPSQYHTNYLVTLHIPKDRTQGRTITRVLSLAYGEGHAQGHISAYQMGTVPLLEAGRQLMASHSPIPVVSTANIRIIGDNVIMVQDNTSIPTFTFLRCYLENERDFGNIALAYYPTFYKLVEYATKAIIYMRLVMKMERGSIFAGTALGEMKAIVDGYADANELYDETLITWTKQSVLNDPESKRRHLKMMMGSY